MSVKLLDLLFPPQCLNCKIRVPEHGTLCVSCWQQIRFISDPLCACCGVPFDYDIGNGALCAGCINKTPPYSKARAIFCYDEHSNKLITSLKYADQTQLAKVYGKWLVRAEDIIADSDIIIPVPMHYLRFVKRRFNQSALISLYLSKNIKIKTIPDAIKRIRKTKPQAGLTRSQRDKNVKNVFIIEKKYLPIIKGKNILLIDDVMTTGATINQCTKILLKAGAKRVNVLTLARVVR